MLRQRRSGMQNLHRPQFAALDRAIDPGERFANLVPQSRCGARRREPSRLHLDTLAQLHYVEHLSDRGQTPDGEPERAPPDLSRDESARTLPGRRLPAGLLPPRARPRG